MTIVIDNTPIERYRVDGRRIYVKREDLSCPAPGPSFSKIRGLARHLEAVKRDMGDEIVIGVMDTQHSKAGWGTAYVCKELGLSCVDFYPVLKADKGLRENQQMAYELGAVLYPMKAGMSAVLFNQAKKIMREELCPFNTNGYMLPNGLKLMDTVYATAREVECAPDSLMGGTWVVSISSGTIGAGVLMGLTGRNFQGRLILHMGYSRSQDSAKEYIYKMSMCYPQPFELIDEGYEYKDKVDNSWIPFPCNEYYDAKAFTWLCRNQLRLEDPVVFWNIGA